MDAEFQAFMLYVGTATNLEITGVSLKQMYFLKDLRLNAMDRQPLLQALVVALAQVHQEEILQQKKMNMLIDQQDQNQILIQSW